MSAAASPLEDDVRPLVRRLGRPPEEWGREDLVRLCLEDGVRVVNLRYTALDGKLKELRLPINGRAHLERLLAAGERVDGSSVFPGLLPASESDLYVVPVYRWAFLNPWAPDELEVVCRFADRDGAPAAATPDNVLAEAARRFGETGYSLDALAELEFYVLTRPEHDRFPGVPQRGYHQSSPYLHSRDVLDDVLRTVAAVTGRVKYCHSEVGYIERLASDEPELDGCRVEQHELELELMPIEDLGCWLTVARWLVREVANRRGASATFLPKLDEGMAGSGMHLHLALRRDGRNATADGEGGLSDDALRMVGGILERAQPMTAFGCTVAASYLRLVPGQEAPTRLCWGRQNRATLLRVPLDFSCAQRPDQAMNPGEAGALPEHLARPSVEYRSPDGSAFPQLLLAAVTMSAAAGLRSRDSLAFARELEVKPGAGDSLRGFQQLPGTATAAASALHRGRAFFEEHGMPPRLIDHVVAKLRAERDEGLSESLRALPAAERLEQTRRLMHKDLHKH